MACSSEKVGNLEPVQETNGEGDMDHHTNRLWKWFLVCGGSVICDISDHTAI